MEQEEKKNTRTFRVADSIWFAFGKLAKSRGSNASEAIVDFMSRCLSEGDIPLTPIEEREPPSLTEEQREILALKTAVSELSERVETLEKTKPVEIAAA